jgi:hypothetical protein
MQRGRNPKFLLKMNREWGELIFSINAITNRCIRTDRSYSNFSEISLWQILSELFKSVHLRKMFALILV